MGFLGSILDFFSRLFSFLHDRKVAQGARANYTIATQQEILEAVKDEQITDSKPLSDELLITPDERAHNHD